MSEETRIETVRVYQFHISQFDIARRSPCAAPAKGRGSPPHPITRLDPERIKPGSAGHGTFNPAAGGSSPPGFAFQRDT
jgi:hypothetical protein